MISTRFGPPQRTRRNQQAAVAHLLQKGGLQGKRKRGRLLAGLAVARQNFASQFAHSLPSTYLLQPPQLLDSFGFRPVEMFAGQQIGVFFKMFRAQRFGNDVLVIKPLAEVNELAAMGTKRRVFSGGPVTGFLAGWAFGLQLPVR